MCCVFALLVFKPPFVLANYMSIALLVIGTGLIIGLHISTPNLDPLHHFVSQYSLNGRCGTTMRIAFYLIAVATFNLSFLLKEVDEISFKDTQSVVFGVGIRWIIFGAGIFTALMGVFSQRSTIIDDIKNTELEGNMHSVSSALSFGFAAASMLMFALPSTKLPQAMEWNRAFALCLFSITLITIILQLILGIRKIKIVAKQKDASVSQLLTQEVSKRWNSARRAISGQTQSVQNEADMNEQQTVVSENKNIKVNDEEVTSLVQANQGLGLTERILIFLFLEWEIIFSFFIFALLK